MKFSQNINQSKSSQFWAHFDYSFIQAIIIIILLIDLTGQTFFDDFRESLEYFLFFLFQKINNINVNEW